MEQIRESLELIDADTLKNLKMLGGPITRFVRDLLVSGDLQGTIHGHLPDSTTGTAPPTACPAPSPWFRNLLPSASTSRP
jgi:hypothetical protein